MPYVRCPACGEKNYVSHSFEDAYWRFGKYYKRDTCSMCNNDYDILLYELKIFGEKE